MNESMEGLLRMNKKALEEYGRTIGIELDRRQTKKKLIKQVEEFLKVEKLEGDALISEFTDTLEVAWANEGDEEQLTKIHENRAYPSQKVLLRDKNTGHFSKGPQPAGASNGRSGGVPYWEI
jgi:hypothetical protein